MFIHYKDKIDAVYTYLHTYFKIEDNEDMNKYIVIELDRWHDELTHIQKSFLTQSIINLILDMDKSIYNPTPVINHY